MATIANIFNTFLGAKSLAAVDDAATGAISDACKLRPLPNEDVYFFAKRLDNSRVVRQSDPRARARDWRLIGGSGVAAVVLIAVLLPSAYGLISGYELSNLQQQQQKLNEERARLEVEESRLISAERLATLADQLGLVDPAPDNTVYLHKNDESLALNHRQH